MKRGTETDIYEVFARFGDNPAEPIRWVGSVRSGDAELAWHAAKEIFTRREDPTVLWVAQRSHMVFSGPEDAGVLKTSRRLPYRVPAFPGAHRRARMKAAETGTEASP